MICADPYHQAAWELGERFQLEGPRNLLALTLNGLHLHVPVPAVDPLPD